jgi:hypothetical protein
MTPSINSCIIASKCCPCSSLLTRANIISADARTHICSRAHAFPRFATSLLCPVTVDLLSLSLSVRYVLFLFPDLCLRRVAPTRLVPVSPRSCLNPRHGAAGRVCRGFVVVYLFTRALADCRRHARPRQTILYIVNMLV